MISGSESDRPVKASVSIVSINNHPFVAGLYWQPLTRLRAYMKEAREIGKRENMDIVTIRRGVIMQAGFVAKNQGAVKGMYSLAASLASQLGNSWLGVFEIDADRFALVAVHDGAIVPGYDLIGDRNEIGNKLRTVYNYFTWGEVYAPASFGFGGSPLDIGTLLQSGNLKKANQLHPLTFGLSRKEIALLASVLLVVVGSLAGYAQWVSYQERLRREAAIRAEQARRTELTQNENAKTEQQVLDHPWAKQPAVADFVYGCIHTIYGLHLSVGGWLFQEAQCNGKAVLANYKRRDIASINDFLVESQAVYGVTPIIDAGNGDSASVSLPLEIPPGGDDPLRPADQATADFVSHLQAMGIAIKLTEKPFLAQAPAGTNLPGQPTRPATPLPTPNWKTYIFAVETEIAPGVVFADIHPDGLRFTEIAVRLNDPRLTWNIVGELNAISIHVR
jgi:hypothetical protein